MSRKLYVHLLVQPRVLSEARLPNLSYGQGYLSRYDRYADGNSARFNLAMGLARKPHLAVV